MVRNPLFLCLCGVASALLFCGCSSTPSTDGASSQSRIYEVSARYQLEIKDENGRVVHRSERSKITTVEHDSAALFSEENLMTGFLETADTGLELSVSNVVVQLRGLPPAPTNAPPTPPSAVAATDDNETVAEAGKAPIVPQKKPIVKSGDEPGTEPETTTPPSAPATNVPAVATKPEPAPEPPAPKRLRASNEKEITGGFTVKKVSGDNVTTAKHKTATVGNRYFVRSLPEVIIDPFTNKEKLISKGEVNGVVEIESIGLFGIKARLLSGTVEKGNYLEAIETPPPSQPVVSPENESDPGETQPEEEVAPPPANGE